MTVSVALGIAVSLFPRVSAQSCHHCEKKLVSRFGLVVSRGGLGSNLLRLSFVFKSQLWSQCGHCLVTLSLTVNERLKWLSSLPILMLESFWWRQCSDRYIISFSLTSLLPSPLSPSLISLMVSVGVKHHAVYLLNVKMAFTVKNHFDGESVEYNY